MSLRRPSTNVYSPVTLLPTVAIRQEAYLVLLALAMGGSRMCIVLVAFTWIKVYFSDKDFVLASQARSSQRGGKRESNARDSRRLHESLTQDLYLKISGYVAVFRIISSKQGLKGRP